MERKRPADMRAIACHRTGVNVSQHVAATFDPISFTTGIDSHMDGHYFKDHTGNRAPREAIQKSRDFCRPLNRSANGPSRQVFVHLAGVSRSS